MLPEVSACPLRARSGSKPGELAVTPGEANTAPELGRASSQAQADDLLSNGSRDSFMTPLMRAALHWVLPAARNR